LSARRFDHDRITRSHRTGKADQPNPGALLSVTEVIFDPHFQPREALLKVTWAAGFREKDFFGRKLAYTMHFEKSDSA
jgi:hypothetical protein